MPTPPQQVMQAEFSASSSYESHRKTEPKFSDQGTAAVVAARQGAKGRRFYQALCEACEARSDREYSDSVTKERNLNTAGSEGKISVGGGETEQATEFSPWRSRAEAGARTKPEVAALRRARPKAAGPSA